MKNFLKETRINRQLTQIQLAELVNVSRQSIISIETNRYIPSVLLSIKIAKALEIAVEDLFHLEEND